jgi:hypothetical protein
MKQVKLTANILYYITRILAIVFLAVALYALMTVILFESTHASWVPMQVDDTGLFRIFYPFTKSTFLLGDHTTGYLTTSLTAIIFYSTFLFLLSGVFDAFRKERLFTERGVRQLARFYVANLVLPLILVLLLIVVGKEINDAIIIAMLHMILGIFTYFMCAIFRQGLLLQKEQDLTL